MHANAGSTSRNACFKYDAMGSKTHARGDGVAPARCEYSELGRRTRMWTYRSGVDLLSMWRRKCPGQTEKDLENFLVLKES